MQVAALQLFLRSLVPALEAGDGRAAARGVEEACRALEPFRQLGLGEFTAFLARADEYQRTGAVRVPCAADQRADALVGAVARMTNATDMAAAQAAVARAVEALAHETGLKGTMKPDPKWAEAQADRARVAPLLKAIRDLGGRITTPEQYADESVRAEISRLESAMDGEVLKAIGMEVGVPASARSVPAKVLAEVLAKLSGHKPPKAKRGTKAAAEPADPAVVEANAHRLAGLVERSADPDAVPDSEVDGELARLKTLPKPSLVEVVTRAGIDGVKAKDAVSAILTRVRNRLTAARRARERAEV